MAVKKVLGTLWFCQEEAYYGYPTEQYPVPHSFGKIEPGDILELIYSMNVSGGGIWDKFKRTSASGGVALLWMPRTTTSYGMMPGPQAPRAITLLRPNLLPDEVAHMVAILVPAEIRDEPDGAAIVKKTLSPGTLLRVTKIDGVGQPNDGYVQVKYTGEDGIVDHSRGYFDNKQPFPLQIKAGVEYNKMVLFEGTWSDIGVEVPDPVIPDPVIPDPVIPGPDDPTTDDATVKEIVLAAGRLLRLLLNYQG